MVLASACGRDYLWAVLYINTLSSSTTKMRQHRVVWFYWLLFPGQLEVHMKNFGSWWSFGEQVEGCVWPYSAVVLDEDFFCLSTIILASFQPCMAHTWLCLFHSFTLLRYFKSHYLARNLARLHPPIVELPNITITQCQPLFKMVANFIIGYLNRGWL